ncbi:DedA family protein [Paenibacillus glycanilyticus]|uniref:DedA family protein n=1 Tax=Paenibacillus glycanilyticus TaxID=126569 RepID=UPI0020422206|nr:DedA family protein [Paenibacillus glycanilyticus]MCM3625829.1 DedA family protein [Paenibacillus glycanilyticus]
MGYDFLVSIIDQFGYVSLFLVLCLGLIGLPVPNEVVVMTGGAFAASGLLSPVPAYTMVFLGICSAMTFNYSIGRFAGSKVFDWFMKKKNMDKFVHQAQNMSNKYGGFALSIGLVLPVLRHVMPFVGGTNKMTFRRFALFAYPSAFVWTLIYFIIGSFVGDRVQSIGDTIADNGMLVVYALIAVAAGAAAWLYIRSRTAKKNEKAERPM